MMLIYQKSTMSSFLIGKNKMFFERYNLFFICLDNITRRTLILDIQKKTQVAAKLRSGNFFYSFLKTIYIILCLNSRYCFPIVDFW